MSDDALWCASAIYYHADIHGDVSKVDDVYCVKSKYVDGVIPFLRDVYTLRYFLYDDGKRVYALKKNGSDMFRLTQPPGEDLGDADVMHKDARAVLEKIARSDLSDYASVG